MKAKESEFEKKDVKSANEIIQRKRDWTENEDDADRAASF